MTYHFYFFVGKFPKLLKFSDSMEKIYLLELKIFKKNAILHSINFRCADFNTDSAEAKNIGYGVCRLRARAAKNPREPP